MVNKNISEDRVFKKILNENFTMKTLCFKGNLFHQNICFVEFRYKRKKTFYFNSA